MKIITIWHTVVGICVSGVCGFVVHVVLCCMWFCGVCVVGVWECWQVLNRLNINRLKEKILTRRTPRSGLGKSLKLIGYSSGLPEISEARHPMHVSILKYQCLIILVSGLRSHQKTQSQWYQRFDPLPKL